MYFSIIMSCTTNSLAIIVCTALHNILIPKAVSHNAQIDEAQLSWFVSKTLMHSCLLLYGAFSGHSRI